MKEIQLTNSELKATVDDEDFERANKYNWYLKTGNGKIIQCTSTALSIRNINLSNFILNDIENLIDHKDINYLNNQKENLRISNPSTNIRNRKKLSNNTSGYKGVYWHKGHCMWHACIKVNDYSKDLGGFFTKEEAALAYNKAAKKYFGEFANLNEI